MSETIETPFGEITLIAVSDFPPGKMMTMTKHRRDYGDCEVVLFDLNNGETRRRIFTRDELVNINRDAISEAFSKVFK